MELLKRHVTHTGSTLAARLLTDWSATAKLFVKVMPRDYRRVLEGKSQFGAVELEPIVLSKVDADPAASEVVHG
jgi:glutamate synthase domain-containing protein 3